MIAFSIFISVIKFFVSQQKGRKLTAVIKKEKDNKILCFLVERHTTIYELVLLKKMNLQYGGIWRSWTYLLSLDEPNLHIEHFSLKNTWKLAEQLLHNKE